MNVSPRRITTLVLFGLLALVTGIWMYDVHRPGFNPQELPCHNSPPFLTLDSGNIRVVGCKVKNRVWSETWERTSSRWVRLEEKEVPISRVPPVSPTSVI